VVTIMGHVDHGKTQLLDSIRETRVAAREAGGITQHIGASQIEWQDNRIVFIDTPGHEAFTRMRARGAQVTDLVVLVVAADDGVMPQTVEAIDHAQAAGVPIIVAINKIDLPQAKPDRVMQQLSERGLVPEDWGGDTICVQVSAKEKQNLDDLLEMIVLSAELLELTANPEISARGVVLEGQLDRQRGAVATVLVQEGTLRVGDSLIAGAESAKVRAMTDDRGNQVEAAGPATPVEVLGFSGVPQAGDTFRLVEEKAMARKVAEMRQDRRREEQLTTRTRLTLEDLHERLREGEKVTVPVILKCDARGSVETLRDALEKLSTDDVEVEIIRAGIGGVSENDVLLAAASDALIVGFNVRPERGVADAAKQEDVELRLYTVIYQLIDDVKQAMVGKLEPEYEERSVGIAEVRETFQVPRAGTVAGCYITDGKFTRKSRVRLVRDSKVVYEGRVASLRRFKDDVSEVQQGYECGIGLENYNDVKIGDRLEAYELEEIAREL
ncbi:MAG: translation initiation factor IF-2, partial [Acidobacteriota bacterium]